MCTKGRDGYLVTTGQVVTHTAGNIKHVVGDVKGITGEQTLQFVQLCKQQTFSEHATQVIRAEYDRQNHFFEIGPCLQFY